MHMNNIQAYTEAVRIIKEAILQSQYRAVSIANKEQLSYIMALANMYQKTPVMVFGAKVQ